MVYLKCEMATQADGKRMQAGKSRHSPTPILNSRIMSAVRQFGSPMMPHRRSTRARTPAEEDVQPDAIRADPPLNSKGLSILPVELLLEILSYMQRSPIPCLAGQPQVLTAEYLERSRALRGLSQLCRFLRFALLPLVWERVEVCAINTPHAWCKALATDLVEQLEIVTIREPSYAAHVKYVR